MKAALQEKFDHVLDACDAFLRELGYRKRSRQFLQWCDDERLRAFGLQTSRDNKTSTTRFGFFVNAGVVDPLIARIDFPDRKREQLNGDYATFGWRIDAPEHPFGEWVITAESSADDLAARVKDGIAASLSRMDAVPSRADLLEQLIHEKTVISNRFLSAKAAVVLARHLGDADALVAARALLERHARGFPDFDVEAFVAADHESRIAPPR